MDGGTATAVLLLPITEGSSTAPAIMDMDMDMDIRCIGDDAVGGSIARLLELLLLLLVLVARDGGSMAP